MRRLLTLSAAVFCLALPAPESFRKPGCDFASLTPVPKTVPKPGDWKPTWEAGVLRSEVTLKDVTGSGDTLHETITTTNGFEGGGGMNYTGHLEVEYTTKPGRTPAEGSIEISVSQRNGKTGLSLRKAFMDGLTLGDGELVGIPRAVRTETGNHRTSSLMLRQLLEAMQDRHKLPPVDEVYGSEIINFPTNLKILAAELRWKKAHPGAELPESVRADAFIDSPVFKYHVRTMRDAGYELALGASPISSGRVEKVGDYLEPTENRPAVRAAENQRAWDAFVKEMAETDPDIAKTLSPSTPLFSRYTIKYDVIKKPDVP